MISLTLRKIKKKHFPAFSDVTGTGRDQFSVEPMGSVPKIKIPMAKGLFLPTNLSLSGQ